MSLRISKIEKSKIDTLPSAENDVGFGKFFTDHMLCWEFENEKWLAPCIQPLEPIILHPAACVLQYGQQVFEGMKVFRSSDSEFRFFRPEMNYRRMLNSAKRMCMPEFDPEVLHEAIKALVLLDNLWVPRGEGSALYIRPTYIATEPRIKVGPSNRYKLMVLMSPVSSYYKSGLSPIRIAVETEFVRASKGGVGGIKTAGNYGQTLRAQASASSQGFDQVLWLDARERTFVEEVGMMNVFFVIGDKVVTSPVEDGTILPGVTRECVIDLLRHWGFKIEVRKVSIEEVCTAAETGNLIEAFGTGTAAVVAPIASISVGGTIFEVADTLNLSRRLYDTLVGIQTGSLEDTFGWTETLSI
jgi:branched-chain amino acid aminotransferase